MVSSSQVKILILHLEFVRAQVGSYRCVSLSSSDLSCNVIKTKTTCLKDHMNRSTFPHRRMSLRAYGMMQPRIKHATEYWMLSPIRPTLLAANRHSIGPLPAIRDASRTNQRSPIQEEQLGPTRFRDTPGVKCTPRPSVLMTRFQKVSRSRRMFLKIRDASGMARRPQILPSFTVGPPAPQTQHPVTDNRPASCPVTVTALETK